MKLHFACTGHLCAPHEKNGLFPIHNWLISIYNSDWLCYLWGADWLHLTLVLRRHSKLLYVVSRLRFHSGGLGLILGKSMLYLWWTKLTGAGFSLSPKFFVCRYNFISALYLYSFMYHWRYVVLDIGCIAKYGIQTPRSKRMETYNAKIDRHFFLFRSFQSKNLVCG